MDKRELFKQIQSMEGEFSTAEVVEATGHKGKERTVRRFLAQLVGEGILLKSGSKRGTKYSLGLIPPAEAKKKPKDLSEKTLVSYEKSWLEEYKENQTYYLPEEVRGKLHKVGRPQVSFSEAGTYAHQIFNRLLIDLSYNSSRLEGNTYSVADTEKLIFHGDAPQGKLEEEKVMILNHKEAIRYLVNSASQKELSYDVICTLHYLLSDGLLPPRESGNVRKEGVRIGGSAYIPLENPAQLEGQLRKIVDKAGKISDPFEQSIFLLVHLSYLQAFADVNKRTARIIANIPLVKANFVPLAFSDIGVKEYIDAILLVYEERDVSSLVELYLRSYERSCKAYDVTVQSLGFDEVRVRYRKQRREVCREVILQKIKKKNTEEFVKKSAVSLVPLEDLKDFVEDVLEDIQLMSPTRLVGLGVTEEELFVWQNLQ